MYILTKSEILKNIYTFSYPYLDKDKKLTIPDLKKGFENFLSEANQVTSTSTDLELLTSGKRWEQLVHKFKLDQCGQPKAQKMDLFCLKVNSALNYLKNNDPEYYEIFSVVVKTIFITDSVSIPGSSSSPNTLGAIWIQPNNNWTTLDIIESLVHEFTHNVLYLDENRFGHYVQPEKLNQKQYWLPSAIRNTKRPLDGVAHSILVATEILNLRKKWNYSLDNNSVHGENSFLLRKGLYSLTMINSQGAIQDILGDRMKYLLKRAHDWLNKHSKKKVNL
ncbi:MULTISPECIES: aKG-HExxH-type peptide beta-hydroxylase [unclassified Sporolactobacillus]|uniref:aKG-HExxH-type peptide beta-hydroxylase n=1 Tax=unclassified Sporolactobacillus TaxID=2628533 RepID=UPI002367719D|nr:HEXXH motif-containing putative peptide modification protein [Sporolactobacillus sp. CQH2019]MDD9150470.1 HEXXH motif-containing putative peptide modification protein [Sporolactobacillus sp. CQH2019]